MKIMKYVLTANGSTLFVIEIFEMSKNRTIMLREEGMNEKGVKAEN